ncbi:MAG: hypothetical protein K5888_11295 [Lachnospiraceae bacterium]|nr:hypothetical protein [Lachnospiraceae bacterium]
MDKKILAILDGEERYARGLMEFMSKKESMPFRIHIFTDVERFCSFKGNEDIECLLVAESSFSSKISKLRIPHVIILSESGRVLDSTLLHLGKYQSGEMIYKQILEYYSEVSNGEFVSRRTNNRRMKIIAVYTPIGRCLQTSFSVTLGHILSKKAKTLYLNFENYSGLSSLLKREFESDISDLMYYFECAKEMLSVRLESITEKIGDLDFVPPVMIYRNLSGVRAEKWIELFRHMEQTTEYEYLVLDLVDGMQDMWEILRYSDMVYTISKQDTFARAKVYQYEKALAAMDYDDILEKTKKLSFPVFHHLFQRFDDLSTGELYSFVKAHIIPEIEMLD